MIVDKDIGPNGDQGNTPTQKDKDKVREPDKTPVSQITQQNPSDLLQTEQHC